MGYPRNRSGWKSGRRNFRYPTNTWSFYEKLVEDLYRQSANLNFHFEDVTWRGVTESPEPPTPLFTYHFLKSTLKDFEEAIETIIAEPHRLLCDYPDQVLLPEVSDVDGDVILSILQSPETWVETGDFALSRALQIDGRKYAPERVWQRLPEETFDTPENRFVLYFLRQVLVAAEALFSQSWYEQYEKDGYAGPQKIRELTTCCARRWTIPCLLKWANCSRFPFTPRC